MSDFERSGMTYDEPAKRRTPGTWFADLGERLARGRPGYEPGDEPEWDVYEEEPEQPTAAVDPLPWQAGRKRFPTALHGYDRDAVDAHLAALEREMGELRAQRLPVPEVEAEIERVGEETSAILRVAHAQAAEITRRAQSQADRCVADAAANAVAMTEDAKRKLRHLDSETDAVWAERGRLIDDVRNVATALFSLAEDAAERFPEEGERGAPKIMGMASVAAPAPAAADSGAPAPGPGDSAARAPAAGDSGAPGQGPVTSASPAPAARESGAPGQGPVTSASAEPAPITPAADIASAPPGSAGPPPMPWMLATSEWTLDEESSEGLTD